MNVEILKNTLGVGSPQNSRKAGMGQDLLSVPEFAKEIDLHDALLGVRSHGSLNPELQTASVTFSIAVNKAITEITGKIPGVWTAPSIGENTVANVTGAIPTEYLLPALAIRQVATSNPLTEGVKAMVAFVGIDDAPLRRAANDLTTAVGSRVEAYISNFNAPGEAVLAMNLKDGYTVGDFLADLQKKMPEVPKIRAFPLDIPHAFHSPMIRLEQAVFEAEVKKRYSDTFFRNPNPDFNWYSPMLIQWIKNADQVRYLFFHQLTETVHFDQAVHRILVDHEIERVITTDVTETALKMTKKNFPKQLRKSVQYTNISDRSSFDKAVESLI